MSKIDSEKQEPNRPQVSKKGIFRRVNAEIKRLGTADVIAKLFPSAKREGKFFEMANIRGGEGGSLKIHAEVGWWTDFATGEKGGDLIRLWGAHRSLPNQYEALKDLAKVLKIDLGDENLIGKPDANPITPVPDNARDPELKLGAPHYKKSDYRLAKVWMYCVPDGRTHHYRVRFDGPSGAKGKPDKMVLPYSCFDDGHWRYKEPGKDLLPLYNLPALYGHPEAPVLIVEGEKTADAAKLLFPGHVAMTWPGGASRLRKIDWSHLARRRVYYWPDADSAGAETVETLSALLMEIGVESLAVVQPPPELPIGWDLADPAPADVDLDALLRRAEVVDLSARKAFLETTFDELSERLYYVVSEELFFDPDTRLALTYPQLSAAFSHLPEAETANVAKLLLTKFPGRKVDSFGFKPGSAKKVYCDKLGVKYVNRWSPSGVEAVEGDASVFVEHLQYIANTPDEFEFLADTLAFMVQHQNQKLMFAPLIIGEHGAGKSYFGEVMCRLLGKQNTTMVVTSEFKGAFNEFMLDTQLVVVEELMALGRREITNTLKPLITQPRVPLNVKYGRRRDIENYANFFFFSNHIDALKIENSERRFYVIASRAVPKERAYYKQLWSWTDENLGVILHWLIERCLENFSRADPPPMTEGRREMIEAGRSDLERDVVDRISHKEDPFRFDLVELDAVRDFYREQMGKGSNEVQRAMKDAGARSLGQQKGGTGGSEVRYSLWVVRNFEHWNSVGPSERVRAYERFRSGPLDADDQILPF